MRIEEGRTCQVFNRILLALKYLRQATWRQRVSRYLLQRLIRVCYKMLLFYILHSHSKAKYDQSCLEMIRCLLFLQVKAPKAGTSGKVVQFLHCGSLAMFLLPSWPSRKIEMGTWLVMYMLMVIWLLHFEIKTKPKAKHITRRIAMPVN